MDLKVVVGVQLIWYASRRVLLRSGGLLDGVVVEKLEDGEKGGVTAGLIARVKPPRTPKWKTLANEVEISTGN